MDIKTLLSVLSTCIANFNSVFPCYFFITSIFPYLILITYLNIPSFIYVYYELFTYIYFHIDGYQDIAVSAVDSSTGNGKIYFLYLNPNGTVLNYTTIG